MLNRALIISLAFITFIFDIPHAGSLWEQFRSHENDLSINRSPFDLDQSSFTAYKFLLIARDSFELRTKVWHGRIYNGLQFSCQLTYSNTCLS